MIVKCSKCDEETFDPVGSAWVKLSFSGLDHPDIWMCPRDAIHMYKRDVERADELWKQALSVNDDLRKEMIKTTVILMLLFTVATILVSALTYYTCWKAWG